MTKTTNPIGYLAFNTGSDEWEWSEGQLPECEGYTKIERCTWNEFVERFPAHDKAN